MTEKPEIGSTWKARDGRIIQVKSFMNRGSGLVAICAVLNAGKGMRRQTQLKVAAHFGTFLVPHTQT